MLQEIRKCAAHWWGPRTSNPMWGVNTVPGGFDSHALPPKLFIISAFRATFFYFQQLSLKTELPLIITCTWISTTSAFINHKIFIAGNEMVR